MAIERGSGLILALADGAATPTYAPVAGMRTTRLAIAGGGVDATHRGSNGWRELISGAGVRTVSVSGTGVFTGSAAEARAQASALAGVLDDYELRFESGARLRGRFLIERLEHAGDHDGERTYSITLESSGAVVAG